VQLDQKTGRGGGERNEVINLELNLVLSLSLSFLLFPPSVAVKYMTVVLLDCLIRHVSPGGKFYINTFRSAIEEMV
jgi:hypothetical protein